MSKKQKKSATAVAQEVIATEAMDTTVVSEILDTPLNADVPEEVVQTTLDERIESAIATTVADKPKFVSRICSLEEIPARESEIVPKYPVRNYQVFVNGKASGYANRYKYNRVTPEYPELSLNKFSEVFMYFKNADGTTAKRSFPSTKSADGKWTTGMQHAEAWLRRLGAYLIAHPDYIVEAQTEQAQAMAHEA